MKENEYAQLLVEYVKEVGKFLQENADNIVPDCPWITDYGIAIDFDQEDMRSFPVITAHSGTFGMDSKRMNEINNYIDQQYRKEK